MQFILMDSAGGGSAPPEIVAHILSPFPLNPCIYLPTPQSHCRSLFETFEIFTIPSVLAPVFTSILSKYCINFPPATSPTGGALGKVKA